MKQLDLALLGNKSSKAELISALEEILGLCNGTGDPYATEQGVVIQVQNIAAHILGKDSWNG